MPSSPHAGSEGTRRDSKLKLLIIRPGAIGDVIVSLPALEHISASASYVELWVPSACVPLIRFADRVRSIASVGLDLLEFGYDTPARALLQDFDRIVSWYGAARPEFAAAVAGLPVTFHTALPSGAHAVDYYMRQVGGPDGALPSIPVSRTEQLDFIAIHPFSGSPKKNWPLDCFRQLAASLPVPAELSAGPEESLDRARRFDDLPSLAQWLASARLYTGNDSGVTHLAAAVGVPVVSIFRCTPPEVWAPRGRAEIVILRGEPSIHEVRSAVCKLLASSGHDVR